VVPIDPVMMQSKDHAKETLGRPRDDRIDRAVLRVAADMAATIPYGALSLRSIADEARTTRAAIHRRWPSKAHLIVDAFTSKTGQVADVDTGDLRGDLESLTRQNVELFSSTANRGLTLAVLAALGDLGLDYGGMPQPRNASIEKIFERAAERGDLPTTVAPGLVTQLLAGAVLFRTAVLNLPTDDATVAGLVDAVLGTE